PAPRSPLTPPQTIELGRRCRKSCRRRAERFLEPALAQDISALMDRGWREGYDLRTIEMPGFVQAGGLKRMYPEIMVIPMREELTRAGIKEARTADEVDAALAKPGTTMLVVNSICGCAAGKMRPGVRLALQNTTTPDQLITVFAGQDREATERARSYFEG